MADWLDEIEAQMDETSPYYLPRLIAEIRRLQAEQRGAQPSSAPSLENAAGRAEGRRDDLRTAPPERPAPAASSGAPPQDRVALAVEALRDESLPHGAARFAALSILDPEPIRPADIEWAKRELAAAPPERPTPAAEGAGSTKRSAPHPKGCTCFDGGCIAKE